MGKNNTNFGFNWQDASLDFNTPKIMGIVNITPDSFYDGGITNSITKSVQQAINMVEQGAHIIDVGGQSTRPDATQISPQQELDRIALAIETILQYNKNIIISVDTFYSYVAENAIQLGAKIINDVSAGDADKNMLAIISKYKIPYIAMHKKGTPINMQVNPTYNNVVKEIIEYFKNKINIFNTLGITQFAIDPGIGFGKTIEHNFEILKNLKKFKELQAPILIGLSRKSFIYKTIQSTPQNALNGTTALHMQALIQDANIIRVHDVAAAKEVVTLYNKFLY